MTDQDEPQEKLELEFSEYKSIVENANDGIIVIQDGLVSFANKKAEILLGIKIEDAIGEPFLNFIHPNSLSLVESRYKQRMSGVNIPSIYETSLRRVDGTPISVEVNAKLITYKNSPANLIFIRDPSERSYLKESMTTFMNSSPVAFYLLNSELILIDTNKAGIDRFKGMKNKNDLVGAHLTEMVPNIENTDRYQQYLDVVKTGIPTQVDTVKGDGPFEEKYYSVRAFKAGNGLGIISSDITDRVEAEQAVRQVKQQLQDTFDHTPFAVYVKDLEGRYLLVNKVWRERTGLNNQDILGKNDIELFPAYRLSPWSENEKKVLKSGISTRFEEVGRTSRRIYLATKFLLTDDTGKPYALCNSSLDITARKNIEEALRKSEQKYRMLVERMEEAVFLEDAEGRIIFVNPRGVELLKISSEEEILGHHWSDFTPPEALEMSRIESAKRPLGISSTYETQMQAKDETIIPIQIAATPIFTENNNFNGVLCVYTDLTERTKAEERLKKVKREEELFHTMQSHFIKNDLQKITFALELEQRSVEKEDRADFKDIISVCHRASRTIDRVNKIYSVLQSEFDPDVKPHSLIKLIHKVSLNFGFSVNFKCEGMDLRVLMDDYFTDLLIEIFSFIEKSAKNIISLSCGWSMEDNSFFNIIIEEHDSDPLPNDLCFRISQGVTEEWESLGHYSGLTLASVVANYYGGKLLISPMDVKGNEFLILLPSSLIKDA
ncbi:MAG: PAS domain S-box protein [Candidatus Hodarchaeales archaeon]